MDPGIERDRSGRPQDGVVQPASGKTSGKALGNRGRGLFGRLLGGLGTRVGLGAAAAAPATRRQALTIAVAGGKGGTGKSFLATSLAVLLHRAGTQLVLVDCDFGLACDHLLLGVRPQLTLQQLVAGRAALDDVLCTSPCGVRLLPGASGVRQMAAMPDRELLAFARAVDDVAAREQLVLLDLGAGIAPPTMLTMLAADWIVLVTQAEIAALVDAYAVVKCVAQVQPKARFLVVVNRVTVPGRGEQAFTKLLEVARQHVGLELHFLGEIPEEERVTQHRLGQLPLCATEPDSEFTGKLQALCERLRARCGGIHSRDVPADQGFRARFQQHRVFLT